MKYLDEYRDPAVARRLLDELRSTATAPWRIMEVCGGQAHTLVRQGIDELLPAGMRMIPGPGCPVCGTPLQTLDRAMAVTTRPGVTLASFGDMLRVPGTDTDLLSLRARGADIQVVYTPMDAVRLAREHPHRHVVFPAVGFETTAPANAMAVLPAARLGPADFSMLVSQVLVPPAMTALLEDPDCEVQAFLAPGHVCAVMGRRELEPIAGHHRVPIVVTGFEPLDLLEGILMAGPAAGRGPARGGEPVRASRTACGQRRGAARRAYRVPCDGPRLTGHREAARQRPGTGGGVRAVRRGAPVRRRPAARGRGRGVHRRCRAQGRPAAHGTPRLRHPLHAPSPARRADGLGRGHLRRLHAAGRTREVPA